MLAVIAFECPLICHYENTTFDIQTFAVHNGIGNFSSRRLDNASERRSGDAHLFGGFFVRQALEVSEPESFEFIHLKLYLLCGAVRDAFRAVARVGRVIQDVTCFKRSCHLMPL